MKAIFRVISPGYFRRINITAVSLLSCIMLSCSTNTTSEIAGQKDIPTFDLVTQIHRVSMDKAFNDFEPDLSIAKLSDGIKYVREFNKRSIVESIELTASQQELLTQGLIETQHFLTDIDYSEKNKSETGKNTSLSEVQATVISELIGYEVIDQKDADILKRLTTSFKLAEQGDIAVNALADSLDQFELEYLSANHGNGTQNGYITGSVLAVAKESYTWWLNNPDAIRLDKNIVSKYGIQNKVQAIPVVVANDIAGTLVGAGIAVTGQMIINGEIDWAIVGWSAVSGAVIGSTGVVSKIGGWISNLF